MAIRISWMLAGSAGRLFPAGPPRPSPLWQVDLSELECPIPSFDSEFDATRQAVFASEDRIVVSYPGSPSGSDGKTLLTPVCTLAINVSDGSVLASRKQTVITHRHPLLLPTAGRQVILATGGAVLLNSGLNFQDSESVWMFRQDAAFCTSHQTAELLPSRGTRRPACSTHVRFSLPAWISTGALHQLSPQGRPPPTTRYQSIVSRASSSLSLRLKKDPGPLAKMSHRISG